MWSTARAIAAGDLVIIWLTRDLVQPLYVTPGKELNSKFGNYRHSDLVGIPYGSKVGSRNGKGFVHVLRPTPELWTMALPHRTQILYLSDIAFITSWLDIKSGSRVIEAEEIPRCTIPDIQSSWCTGSGSFTHSTVRTIGPKGHLWSYEFHEARYNKAREEFERHGMSDVVTLTHRNVCKDGFTVEEAADSVFLDLPAPWDAVEHAKKALRKDRLTRICCFSPCMEQVLRTVSALNDAGFTDITMYESLIRPQDVAQVPKLQSIGEVSDRLKMSEKKREEKRQRQIAEARLRGPRRAGDGKGKRKREDGDVGEDVQVQDTEGVDSKKIKTEEELEIGEGNSVLEAASLSVMSPATAGAPIPMSGAAFVTASKTPVNSALDPSSVEKIVVSKTFPEVRGHTSYLTFACLLPVAGAFAPQSTVKEATGGEGDSSMIDLSRGSAAPPNAPEVSPLPTPGLQ